ncbi:DUF397 domain-containing protein [Streptomyces sp. NPDC048560]|uniref:DUF397 domain-containing protein n=1 Tax=Streptomyces sp. NPDC048560 TaxID=3155488 RepID=UPI003432B19C
MRVQGTEREAVEDLTWFKSSYSSEEGGECVEVAVGNATVHVRDSKVAPGPILTVSSQAWAGLVGLAIEGQPA